MNDIKNSEKEFSVVIPCLNEERTLAIVVRKALKSFYRLNIDGEVIVSDNGSTDNSVKIALEEGARVVHSEKKGYGSALISGFSEAKGRYIIMGDADDSYNFDEIDDFIRYLREGYDFVMGTRLKGHIEVGAMPFLHRYIGTPILTFVLNLFFGTRISDCNCGMRGIEKSAVQRLSLVSSGMEFASEMVIKAGILGLKLKEVPITLYKDKRDRPPHLHTWRDGWRHLKFMLLYAPDFVFIWPATFFLSLGTALMLLQIRGPFIFGGVSMDIHSFILGFTFNVVGVSILQMGAIIKLYSHLNHYYTSDRIVSFFKSFTFERSLIFGGLILITGISIDALIFLQWFNNGFQNIQLSRFAIFGLYFIFVGISFISFSFLRVIMEND